MGWRESGKTNKRDRQTVRQTDRDNDRDTERVNNRVGKKSNRRERFLFQIMGDRRNSRQRGRKWTGNNREGKKQL